MQIPGLCDKDESCCGEETLTQGPALMPKSAWYALIAVALCLSSDTEIQGANSTVLLTYCHTVILLDKIL